MLLKLNTTYITINGFDETGYKSIFQVYTHALNHLLWEAYHWYRLLSNKESVKLGEF